MKPHFMTRIIYYLTCLGRILTFLISVFGIYTRQGNFDIGPGIPGQSCSKYMYSNMHTIIVSHVMAWTILTHAGFTH